MVRRKNWSAEQIVAKLQQIEVQMAQGKSLALSCKEAEISEQSFRTSAQAQDLLQLTGGACRAWSMAPKQGLRTPTGPFAARFCTGFIPGRAARSSPMR